MMEFYRFLVSCAHVFAFCTLCTIFIIIIIINARQKSQHCLYIYRMNVAFVCQILHTRSDVVQHVNQMTNG